MKAVAAGLVLGLAALTIHPAVAQADEPTAADSESALQLYKEGKAARERGDLPTALEKLRAAYALAETPITALELGKTYVASGKLVEAREILLTVARIPVRRNESGKAAEARAEAESLAVSLRPRLASLTVRPKGTSGATARVSVDGVLLPQDAASAPRILNPGAHVVVVESNGKRAQADVQLGEGESKDVDVDVSDRSAVNVPSSHAGQVEPPPVAPSSGTSPLVPIGFITAGVGLAVGSITGVVTLSTASTLKDDCSSDGRCPASSRSDLDAVSTTGAVSTIAFIVAGVGAVVGVVGLLTPPRRGEPHPRAGLRLHPTSQGLGGSF